MYALAISMGDLAEAVMPAAVIAIVLYWLWVLLRRVRSSEDSSVRKSISTGMGYLSVLVSGVYVSAALAGAITVLTWPLVIETPAVAVALAAGVAVHALLEKREDMGGDPVLEDDD